jgi:hypothetical protein
MMQQSLSAAGSALFADYGASMLKQQVGEISDEERKRRQQEQFAQRVGLSPAGRALAYGGAMLSF